MLLKPLLREIVLFLNPIKLKSSQETRGYGSFKQDYYSFLLLEGGACACMSACA